MRAKASGFWAWLVIVTIVTSIFIGMGDTEPPNELTEEQRRAIVAHLHTEVLFGQLLYNLPQTLPPSVQFAAELPNRNAALSACNHAQIARGESTWVLTVNELLAAQHWDRYLSETIPHEAAHFILCQVGEDWSAHGTRWETTVRDIGATPVAFHSY